MDLELIKKIDELIDIFEKSEEIKRIEFLKKEIYNNKKIKEKIEQFNRLKDNIYSSELIQVKKEILDIKEIKDYKKIENDLLLLTFAINHKLNSLISTKGCQNENN